ncbi:MAG: dihydrolipoamide acetyltransferase family protein [Candidatus Omnitrophica bacterium]|nr:dihydrolipoamide acetyltransferase family protein [Candidatus Omnitrophota bacterium]
MIREFKIPALGENIVSGTVVGILVKAGDAVKKDATLLEIEASKATIEVPSPYEGVVKEILVAEGQEVKVGQVIMKIETADQETQEKKETQAPSVSLLASEEAPSAPSAKRIAREKGIDISKVKGSGPQGEILEDDVSSQTSRAEEGLPDFSKWGEVERKALSDIRLSIAGHMSRAWSVIPHVTLFNKADVTELEKLIKEYSKPEQKLTITPFFIKIIASALKVFPQLNASIDINNRQIIYKKYFHIGVAVDTEKGLVVPVIRDADKKNILTLAAELKELAERARAGKLKLEEMQGGCFSLTNLGGIGGTGFSAVINWPEAAILGLARSRQEPVFTGGKFEARSMLNISLTFDHRVIDGAYGMKFLRWVSEAAEKPVFLELEG